MKNYKPDVNHSVIHIILLLSDNPISNIPKNVNQTITESTQITEQDKMILEDEISFIK